MASDTKFMENLTALCKRRGFIFQSSEIYGGIAGFWDYGPLGVELKRNIKEAWWRDMVTNAPDGPDGKEVKMVGLDCSIIMNPKVWEASGHATGFQDPMVACTAEGCKKLLRADQVFGLWVREIGQEANARLTAEDQVLGDARHQEVQPLVIAQSMDELVDRALRTKDLKKSRVEDAHFADDARRGVTFTNRNARTFVALAGTIENWTGLLSGLSCPACGTAGALTEPRAFNLMFESHAGALQDAASKVYLRPETAQGIFANFMNVMDTSRVKVPFGIAQIGKSFRNEINPRNYTFRSREFEQMEIEFFCHEADSMKWYEYWRKVRFDWYVNLGLKSEKLRLRDQKDDELAHYSKACADIEYLFPFSDEHQELEGVAHRGNYDLTQHQEHSGKDLTYFDDDAWDRDKDKHPKDQHKEIKNKPPYRFRPTVIEPSAGADRATLAFLCEAYTVDEAPDDKGKMQSRTLMKFHPKLAPIKAAVFPLVNKEGMPDVAEKIYRDIRQHMPAFYDVKGAIGRRYRRQDEVGTPFCITVDGDTLSDGTVTIRHRDTLEQSRVPKEGVVQWLQDHLRA